jgi:hypothetical protein
MKILACILLTATAAFRLVDPATSFATAPQDPLRQAPQHAVLQQRVGTWDATLRSRDFSGAEITTTGKLTVRKHSEFHTVEDCEADFMGQKMLGHGVASWCPLRKQFVVSWTDSMTPVPVLLTGSYDEKKRELVMTGECFCPTGKLARCRAVTAFHDDQHFEYTFFATAPDGQQVEVLHIDYRRSK